jgi:hypothetical protein
MSYRDRTGLGPLKRPFFLLYERWEHPWTGGRYISWNVILGEIGGKGWLKGEGGLTGSTLQVTIYPIDRFKATN